MRLPQLALTLWSASLHIDVDSLGQVELLHAMSAAIWSHLLAGYSDSFLIAM